MREALVSLHYFETYYYANVVHNVLSNPTAYIRGLNDWHEDREPDLFLQPFPKWSLLHDFAHFLIEQLMHEELDDVVLDSIVNDARSELWVDRALRHHGFQVEGFRHWLSGKSVALADATEDHIYDYHQDLQLTGELDALLTQLSNEVFFLLFNNRALLANLNGYAAGIVHYISPADLSADNSSLLAGEGKLPRVRIPEWARRAVFFRDRGMCAACNKDISGVVSIASLKHFDHIVPLAEGGINDVTNIQLLCDGCNLSKGSRPLATSIRYEAWYT